MIEQLSLGHIFLDSNELHGVPVVTLNYVNPDHRLVLPYPDGDWYLRNTAVPASTCGEFIICNRLVSGLRDYYTKLGLIPNGTIIEEIEPQVDGKAAYGFPLTDPMQAMQEQYFRGATPYYLVSTFWGELVSEQATRLGLRSLERPDSVITNNKAKLRRFAAVYGYDMLPGDFIREEADFIQVAQRFGHLSEGVWLKFPTGSGGDLVRFCREISAKFLKEGVHSLRSAVLRAFQQGKFGVNAEGFWPEGNIVPEGFPVVIESDARNLGEILINGSTQMVTGKSSQVRLIGHFRQITTAEGEYLGNRPYFPEDDASVETLIEEQAMRVAHYNIDQNGYYGIQGVDWFLIRDRQGGLQVRVTELNSRPTANTPPVIIAGKLGARHWINTNVYTDRPIRTIDDYIQVIGEDLAYGKVDSDGLVIPQSFRTLVTDRSIFPSPNFKVLIMAATEQQCDQITDKLRGRGVRFSP